MATASDPMAGRPGRTGNDPRGRGSGKIRPMLILALETSTELGSCALWRDGEIAERLCPPGKSHSETLLPLVAELLAEAGLRVNQLDAIAFDAGPGAFTGLRVACGAAQGLAVVDNLPLIPVSSLEVVAASAGGGQVLAAMDARMGEVYSGAYRLHDGCWQLLGEIRVSAPDAVQVPSGAGWVMAGNAHAAYPALGERLLAAGVEGAVSVMPSAGVLASLAVLRAARGEGIDAGLAAPLYIRDKVAKTVAERLREGGKA